MQIPPSLSLSLLFAISTGTKFSFFQLDLCPSNALRKFHGSIKGHLTQSQCAISLVRLSALLLHRNSPFFVNTDRRGLLHSPKQSLTIVLFAHPCPHPNNSFHAFRVRSTRVNSDPFNKHYISFQRVRNSYNRANNRYAMRYSTCRGGGRRVPSTPRVSRPDRLRKIPHTYRW